MFSRKWVFITGLAGFAVSSAIGGAAGSFGMLVTARTLQGAFGAILAPSALGTLVSTFQDPRERGKAFGVFSSVAAGGGAVGLLLGGVLTEYFSWRWTLYVNLVFAAVAAVGALVYIRSSRPAARPRMDWPGTVLASTGLFLIVFGFSHAETAGWTAVLTIGSLVLGLLLLAAFVLAERRVSHPLLPLRVILDRTRGGAYVAVGLAGISIFGVFLALTATASYLAAHPAGALVPAIAATHGYTRAFAVSAALLGLGVILAVVLLPSRHRLAELRNAAAPAAVPQPERHAIPVALVSCSPVIVPVPGSSARQPSRPVTYSSE